MGFLCFLDIYLLHFSAMGWEHFSVSEDSILQQNMIEAITRIHLNNKLPDMKSIYSYQKN